ncbi:MAG: hypothetical protein HOH43_01080 [Candidatus Latescibacteria bacterium]|nr:hypothetical protein [Candidatus Latescibacterota bacterium]
MMSDLYSWLCDIPESTGFEGTASDHLKEEMQAIHIRMQRILGENLRCINFWINASAYRDDCMEGAFELSVQVDSDDGNRDTITYKHAGPTLEAALDHCVRHIQADIDCPKIPSGSFLMPKLIAAQ